MLCVGWLAFIYVRGRTRGLPRLSVNEIELNHDYSGF